MKENSAYYLVWDPISTYTSIRQSFHPKTNGNDQGKVPELLHIRWFVISLKAYNYYIKY